jgi:hypothetical protein
MAFSQAGNVDAHGSNFYEIHGDLVICDAPHRGTKAIAIYQWLSAPDVFQNQTDAFEQRQDSTGTWFLDGSQFSKWKTEANSFLSLYGIRMFLRKFSSQSRN